MKIRKCERIVVWNATDVANLNPDDFRNLSVPFEGESDEEFLAYLEGNKWELEEIYEEISEDVLNELNKLWEPEWTEYSNSAWDGEDSWYESGEEDESYRKTGGFEVLNSTARFD
jgi:hypothetical protein